jgi:hypothetical protein
MGIRAPAGYLAIFWRPPQTTPTPP